MKLVFTACGIMHYTTSCKHSLVLLRMGEIIRRNMLHYITSCKHSLVLLRMGEIIHRNMVHYTTSCKHSLVLLRIGEIIHRNMVHYTTSCKHSLSTRRLSGSPQRRAKLSQSKLATKVDRTHRERRWRVNAVATPVTGINPVRLLLGVCEGHCLCASTPR